MIDLIYSKSKWPLWVVALLILIATAGMTSAAEGPSPPPARLEALIQEALEKNPEVLAARQRVEASRARIPQSAALPDPRLSLRIDNISKRITIGEEDMSQAGVEISQMIPFPGKRSLMKQMAKQESEREAVLLKETQRRVVAEVKMLYYELYLAHRSQAIVEQTRQLMQTLADTAQIRYSVGEGLQQDVLRAQTELARLLERKIQIDQQKEIIRAQINSLLRRGSGAELGDPESVHTAPLPSDQQRLLILAVEKAPRVQASDRMVAMKERSLSLARREYYPDFEVSLGYLDRGGLDSMYEAMVSVNLPIYFWARQRPRVQEMVREVHGMQEERASAQQQVQARVLQLYLETASSYRLLSLFSDGILPQARLSLESARAGYTVGKVDFLTLLDNAIKLLEDELNYQEILVRYQKALAGLEELTGLSLTEG